MTQLIPLSLLQPGRSARVGYLDGGEEDVRRLTELGFREGHTVEMVSRGTPCIVRLSGSKFCFRENDSFRVYVQVEV